MSAPTKCPRCGEPFTILRIDDTWQPCPNCGAIYLIKDVSRNCPKCNAVINVPEPTPDKEIQCLNCNAISIIRLTWDLRLLDESP